jgi:aminoglycoside phosphotransferase (APT) family kinase protein
MTPDLRDLRPQLAAFLGAEIALIAVLGTGWETTIYEFTIGTRAARLQDLPVHAPLVLRLYDGVRAEDKAAREGATLSALANAGYPVPRLYVRELNHDALGAPFIIIDRVAGGPLFSATSFPLAFKTFSLGFIAFVRAQVRLHRLSLSGPDSLNPDALPPSFSNAASSATDAPMLGATPLPATPSLDPSLADALPRAYSCSSIPPTASLLDRLLGIIAERVASGPLPGLADALASLRDRAPRYRPAPDTLLGDVAPGATATHEVPTPGSPLAANDAAPDVSSGATPPTTPDALATPRERHPAATSDTLSGDASPARRDALARMPDRAPRLSVMPDSIVHMDYHPQNVLVRGIHVTGVIDWVSADRGDRHLDAATTSAILATSAMDRPRWMRDNRVGNSLRALFAALYFPAYHALAPMDLERFRYCQAVAALFRLSTFGMMRTRGPASVGFRPEAIANVTPDVVRLLTRYASRKSGVSVSLPPQS